MEMTSCVRLSLLTHHTNYIAEGQTGNPSQPKEGRSKGL